MVLLYYLSYDTEREVGYLESVQIFLRLQILSMKDIYDPRGEAKAVATAAAAIKKEKEPEKQENKRGSRARE